MTDGGSLMALRMGTSIMPASIVAAVNPALWHLLLLLFPYKYYVSSRPREMDEFCVWPFSSRTRTSFDICVP